MKGIIELVKSLFVKKQETTCCQETPLLGDVVKEMAAMQAETKTLREQADHALNQMVTMEKDVARLTMALAQNDMEKKAMAKEMAAVILHMAKEEAE